MIEQRENLTPRQSRAITPRPDGINVKISNPAKGARVIYDGIENSKPIRIEPGKSVQAVISRNQIDALKKKEHADPNSPDLHVEELGPEDKAGDKDEGQQPEQRSGVQQRAPRPPTSVKS